MDRMTLGVEEAACRILERLGHKLSDAEVDYETFAGVHNFIINHAGTRFRVQFAEQALRRKSVEDLEEVIHKVAERVPTNSTLRPLQYGNSASIQSNPSAERDCDGPMPSD